MEVEKSAPKPRYKPKPLPRYSLRRFQVPPTVQEEPEEFCDQTRFNPDESDECSKEIRENLVEKGLSHSDDEVVLGAEGSGRPLTAPSSQRRGRRPQSAFRRNIAQACDAGLVFPTVDTAANMASCDSVQPTASHTDEKDEYHYPSYVRDMYDEGLVAHGDYEKEYGHYTSQQEGDEYKYFQNKSVDFDAANPRSTFQDDIQVEDFEDSSTASEEDEILYDAERDDPESLKYMDGCASLQSPFLDQLGKNISHGYVMTSNEFQKSEHAENISSASKVKTHLTFRSADRNYSLLPSKPTIQIKTTDLRLNKTEKSTSQLLDGENNSSVGGGDKTILISAKKSQYNPHSVYKRDDINYDHNGSQKCSSVKQDQCLPSGIEESLNEHGTAMNVSNVSSGPCLHPKGNTVMNKQTKSSVDPQHNSPELDTPPVLKSALKRPKLLTPTLKSSSDSGISGTAGEKQSHKDSELTRLESYINPVTAKSKKEVSFESDVIRQVAIANVEQINVSNSYPVCRRSKFSIGATVIPKKLSAARSITQGSTPEGKSQRHLQCTDMSRSLATSLEVGKIKLKTMAHHKKNSRDEQAREER